MSLSYPWQSLSDEYFEPDTSAGDVLYQAPTTYPPRVFCWKAHHRYNQKTFIFKSIHTSQIDNLKQELKTMGYFKEINHPHLAQVYNIIHPQGSEWVHYQMEYCEGESLSYHLRDKILWERSFEIIQAVLAGLFYLHHHPKRLVHRDLKPANIFFCKDGSPKIGDYGLVRSQKWLTYLSSAGTPAYRAPEMRDKASFSLRNKRDHRCDIYSVGVILWEMLSGDEPPLPTNAPRPEKILPSIWEVIIKATEPDPDKRFQTSQEFQKALKNVSLGPEEKLLRAIFASQSKGRKPSALKAWRTRKSRSPQ